MQRAVENDWSQPGLRVLSQAVNRDAAHWKLVSPNVEGGHRLAGESPTVPSEPDAVPVKAVSEEAPPKLAYSVSEAVAATSIGKTTLWNAIADGMLATRKAGTRTIILAEDLSAYLAGLPAGLLARHRRRNLGN